MSFVKAAYKILKLAQEPLTTEEIVSRAINKDLIKTHGKTPVDTMWASLYNENKRREKRGQKTRFTQHPNRIWELKKE